MNFIDNLTKTINNEKTLTTNGAVAYKSTGTKLLDLNFSVTSLRNASETEIINKFMDAFYENKIYAMRWLFWVRDIRGDGMGERRLFRTIMTYLAKEFPDIAKAVMDYMTEVGRWDDLLVLFDTELKKEVVGVIKTQLLSDFNNYQNGKSISLLAKWMWSVNSKNANTRKYALKLCHYMNIHEDKYRKMLSKLRAYLDIVEVKMSAKRWNEIEYSKVPSKANIVYNKAFLRNDEERRRKYLDSLQKGETKINASTLFPHDIVNQYCGIGRTAKPFDAALEELWKALPDYVKGNGNTICVTDGSGSMTSRIGNTNVSCLNVANALSIYFSERASGQFKDKFITFSRRPQLIDMSQATSLREKLNIMARHNEVANTNIEAVFDLILRSAIENNMTQDDMPENILILSDMQFDSCCESNSGYLSGRWGTSIQQSKTLFETIAKKYAAAGYLLPRLCFLNICGRTDTIPVKQNELGVALISGFSPAIAKMVLSNKTDPFECLLEQIMAPRYDVIEERLTDILKVA